MSKFSRFLWADKSQRKLLLRKLTPAAFSFGAIMFGDRQHRAGRMTLVPGAAGETKSNNPQLFRGKI
jgi:hypothetical protein